MAGKVSEVEQMNLYDFFDILSWLRQRTKVTDQLFKNKK